MGRPKKEKKKKESKKKKGKKKKMMPLGDVVLVRDGRKMVGVVGNKRLKQDNPDICGSGINRYIKDGINGCVMLLSQKKDEPWH